MTKFDKKYYSGFKNNWDDHYFRDKIMEYINPNDIILDIGAGAGIVPQMNFKGLVKEVHGIDPDPRVKSNPFLNISHVGFGDDLPYPNDYFDVIFCDNVLEHLDKPEKVFSEIKRVLKTEGMFLGKTPNKYHYMPLISSMTPHFFHQYYNKFRGRDTEDTFPARYKANSKNALKKLSNKTGFRLEFFKRYEGRPEYLRKIPILKYLGLLYERIVNFSNLFSPFRILIIAVLKKV